MSYFERRLAAAKAAREARVKEASAMRRAANREHGEERLQEHERVRARPIVPNTRYMTTRRTLERRMFLLADDDGELANFFGYTLGRSLERHGQALHAATTMSNHHHTCTTDRLGTLPSFKNDLHAFVARGINARRGRSDAFWSADDPCDIEQLTDEETLEDIVYVYTNPVEAGLVKWARLWPGFSTYGWKFGETHRFRRPKWFYDPANPDNPPYVDITLVRPRIYMHLTDEELYDLIMQRVRERELEIQREMAAKGRRFMGLKKLRKQLWNRAAKSLEERFTLTPKVASTCKWTRIARLQRKREWDREYAIARGARLAGGDPIFPPGTYWMRRFAGVRVASGP